MVCTLLRWENQVGVDLHKALENIFFFYTEGQLSQGSIRNNHKKSISVS